MRFFNRDKCCHCIPLKSGIFTITLVTMAFYIFVAACLFLNKGEFLSHTESEGYNAIKAIYYFQIVLSIIYAILSIIGFIGAFIQNIAVLNFFKVAYSVMSVIQFLLVIPGIVILAKYNMYLVSQCTSMYIYYHPNESIDNLTYTCERGIKSVLIVGSIIATFICFLQFYFIVPIASYVNDVELMLIRKSYSQSSRYPHNVIF